MPSLDALAQGAGMSRFHFHRVFKAVTGVTPKAYGEGHRAQRVRSELTSDGTVTEAIYGAGFNSKRPFLRYFVRVARHDADSNSAPAAAASSSALRSANARSAAILVAATDKGVCAIELGDDPEALVRGLQDRFPNARLIGDDQKFERQVAKVVGLGRGAGTRS